MTCEDCIHYEVCYHIEHYGRHMETEEPCGGFKNKSDYVEVKHGEWKQNPCVERFYYCSECNERIEDATKMPYVNFPYCHCGAIMDGGKKDL